MIYQYQKSSANLEKLRKELSAYSFSYLTFDSGTVFVHSDSALSEGDQTSIGTIISNHTTTDTVEVVRSVILRAIEFGNDLVSEFAAENVLLGITQENMTGVVLDKLSSVMIAVQAGSLYEAMNRIRAIPEEDYDVKYITEARLLAFINKIETYLGLTLSESL